MSGLGGVQTLDLQNRNLMLYSAKLPSLKKGDIQSLGQKYKLSCKPDKQE